MSAQTSIVLVPGAGGGQQAAVAQALTAAGWRVRATSRRPDPDRGDLWAMDPERGDGVAQAMAGVDAIAWTPPQDHRPGAILAMARTLAQAASQAGVSRAALNLATRLPATANHGIFGDLRQILTVFQQHVPQTVVIEPPIFMENILAFSFDSVQRDGVFAYPLAPDQPARWLSHRSLGAFVATALDLSPVANPVIAAGPEALTGPQVAERLASHLQRPVEFRTLTLEVMMAGLDQAFGAPAGERIGDLYRAAAQEPMLLAAPATPAVAARVEPETLAAFLERVSPRPG